MIKLICQEAGSNKFWEGDVRGNALHVRWGKVGTDGQSKPKTFSNSQRAVAELEKLVREKRKKGYVEEGPATKSASSKPASAKGASSKNASPSPNESAPNGKYLAALVAVMRSGRKRSEPEPLLTEILAGDIADDMRAFLSAWAEHEQDNVSVNDYDLDDSAFGIKIPAGVDARGEATGERRNYLCIGQTGGGDLWVVSNVGRGATTPVSRVIHDEEWAMQKEATGLDRFLVAQHDENDGETAIDRALAGKALPTARPAGVEAAGLTLRKHREDPRPELTKATLAKLPPEATTQDPIVAGRAFGYSPAPGSKPSTSSIDERKQHALIVDDRTARVIPITPPIVAKYYQLDQAIDVDGTRCVVRAAETIFEVDCETGKAKKIWTGDYAGVAYLGDLIALRHGSDGAATTEALTLLSRAEGKVKQHSKIGSTGRLTTWVPIPGKPALLIGCCSGHEKSMLYLLAARGTDLRVVHRWEQKGESFVLGTLASGNVYLFDGDRTFEMVSFDAALDAAFEGKATPVVLG
ncbi:hypothetical protein BH11MYX3_BH11MYX3_21300 [soil metagenome]